MALMAAKGKLEPMPDCAIFADTGAEPRHVYDQVEYLTEIVPFPIYTVMEDEGLEKSIIDSIKDGKDKHGRFASAPFYTESPNGKGMLRRQCTNDFKIKPIQRKIRELVGLEKGQRGPKEVAVSQWIGISLDEAARMKPNQTHWIENRWPLIEKEMYRYDCLKWMEENEYPKPGKSACYFCPYHDNKTWEVMKTNDPDSFGLAIKMDSLVRNGAKRTSNSTERLYLHRTMQPIDEVDFNPDRDQFDMFDNECEGLCGV
jgi:hypothetical protein|tara:strand:- start:15 stop:788 length:774 start_codon:yes stop_codon:yes gene_type:complete